jgi:hypothetical protein
LESERPFFADRIYIPEDVDLTSLCLAIIAPVSPGHAEFEFVIDELNRPRTRKMRKAAALLLRSWITEFLAGERPQARFPNRKLGYQPPVSDDHFVETMFRSFSHQATITGRRVGCLDCMNLSIWHLGGHGSWGSSPFSRAWAEARAQERQRIRYPRFKGRIGNSFQSVLSKITGKIFREPFFDSAGRDFW